MKRTKVISTPMLLLEVLGIALLSFAWLSINGHIALTGFLAGHGVALVAACLGLLLMIPAALQMLWFAAKRLAPQLLDSPRKDKKNDADH